MLELIVDPGRYFGCTDKILVCIYGGTTLINQHLIHFIHVLGNYLFKIQGLTGGILAKVIIRICVDNWILVLK